MIENKVIRTIRCTCFSISWNRERIWHRQADELWGHILLGHISGVIISNNILNSYHFVSILSRCSSCYKYPFVIYQVQSGSFALNVSSTLECVLPGNHILSLCLDFSSIRSNTLLLSESLQMNVSKFWHASLCCAFYPPSLFNLFSYHFLTLLLLLFSC